MRFVRKNAAQFHIHPEKIIASGGSTGGHSAAATAFVDSFNDENDDTDVSCVPDALVLYNPVIGNSPGGYGFERVGAEYHNFSLLHNIKKGAPPIIIFLGTNEKLIPVEIAKYYKVAMERFGSVCELRLCENQGHGFFSYKNFEYYKATVSETDKFLQTLGYLNEEPKIHIK